MMKSRFLLTFVWLATASLGWCYAQTDTIDLANTKDTSRYRRIRIDVDSDGENKYVNIVRRRTSKTRVFLLDIGMTGLASSGNYALENSGINPFDQDFSKSLNINVHLYMQRISLIRGHVNFMHGLTLEFFDYGFANPVTLERFEPQATFSFDRDAAITKNKFKVTYLTLPVMLNFETRPGRFSRSFRFSGGMYGGIRIGSKLKQKGEPNGKVKLKDDFNLHRYRAGFRAQIGYGPVNLYGTLNITELFDTNQNGGYEVFPFTVGLTVVPF